MFHPQCLSEKSLGMGYFRQRACRPKGVQGTFRENDAVSQTS
jgi:hypothetical protein